jgi:hypothetical protein
MKLAELSHKYRQLLAPALGALLLVLLLLLVSFDGRFEAGPPERLALREVEIYTPPPPPPPPPVEQSDSSSAIPSLALASNDNNIELELMDLDVKLETGGASGFGTGLPGVGEGLGDGWGTVGLSDLDGVPMVRSAPLIEYPKEAAESNVNEFRVVVHVVVDEEGRSYPVQVVENPFPSSNQAILSYTAAVRFTPPTRLGVPVRAEYLWPLLLKKPASDEEPESDQ